MRIKASVTVPFPSKSLGSLGCHACPVPFHAVTDDELGKFFFNFVFNFEREHGRAKTGVGRERIPSRFGTVMQSPMRGLNSQTVRS